MDKKIRLAAVKERTPRLIEALTAVWEHSVRATHHFLSEPEILRIRAYVPQAVGGVAQLVAAENQAGEPVGFMGVENALLLWQLSSTRKLKTEVVPATTGSCLPMSASRSSRFIMKNCGSVSSTKISSVCPASMIYITTRPETSI